MSQALEHRQHIHQLVDQLPSEALEDALQFLEGLSRRALQAGQELELLSIIHRRLASSQQERWESLRQKLELETLTEMEHQELITYSDLLESWNTERVEAVMELAKLRQVDFKVLYQELTPQCNP
ncbi:MAG: hypothetical protein AAGD25_31735 [Cyanobacteria bacterium P01_F01_bin.150]